MRRVICIMMLAAVIGATSAQMAFIMPGTVVYGANKASIPAPVVTSVKYDYKTKKITVKGKTEKKLKVKGTYRGKTIETTSSTSGVFKLKFTYTGKGTIKLIPWKKYDGTWVIGYNETKVNSSAYMVTTPKISKTSKHTKNLKNGKVTLTGKVTTTAYAKVKLLQGTKIKDSGKADKKGRFYYKVTVKYGSASLNIRATRTNKRSAVASAVLKVKNYAKPSALTKKAPSYLRKNLKDVTYVANYFRAKRPTEKEYVFFGSVYSGQTYEEHNNMKLSAKVIDKIRSLTKTSDYYIRVQKTKVTFGKKDKISDSSPAKKKLNYYFTNDRIKSSSTVEAVRVAPYWYYKYVK